MTDLNDSHRASVLILLRHWAGISLVSALYRWSCDRSTPRGVYLAGSQLAVPPGFFIPANKHRENEKWLSRGLDRWDRLNRSYGRPVERAYVRTGLCFFAIAASGNVAVNGFADHLAHASLFTTKLLIKGKLPKGLDLVLKKLKGIASDGSAYGRTPVRAYGRTGGRRLGDWVLGGNRNGCFEWSFIRP